MPPDCVFSIEHPAESLARIVKAIGRCPHVCELAAPAPHSFKVLAVYGAPCYEALCPKSEDDFLDLVPYSDSYVTRPLPLGWKISCPEADRFFFFLEGSDPTSARQTIDDAGQHYLWITPQDKDAQSPQLNSLRLRVLRRPWLGNRQIPICIQLIADGVTSKPVYLNLAAPATKCSMRASPTVALLGQRSTIDLNEFRIVGNYCRYELETRTKLEELADAIRKQLVRGNHTRANFLIWGKPGTGKTSFAKAIAGSSGAHFIEANLSDNNQLQFKALIDQARDSKVPTLCLVDEVDAREGERWPYECFFSVLEDNLTRDQPLVWVMAGSSGAGIEELAVTIDKRFKGPDLRSRIPNQEAQHTIDAMVPGDLMVISCSR